MACFDALALDCALTAGGQIVRVNGADSAGGTASFRVLHYFRDHLGSVRAIVDGDSGDVIEANDYYPFGKRIAIAADPEHDEGSPSAAVPTSASAGSATAQSVASSNRWLFSGKESQSFLSTDIPLLDFGARMYNPITARWTTADPLADKYYDISPYGYCLNNPITHIDDDGQMPHVVAGALIGATVSGVIAAVEGKSWREIAAAATGGAVEGAIVSATGGLSLIKAGIVYVTASALGSATEQMIDHGAIDAKQTISDGIVGAVTTTAGNYVNCGIEKAGSRIATKINTYYSSEEVKHSINKEVKKEFNLYGRGSAGTSVKNEIKKETNARIEDLNMVDQKVLESTVSASEFVFQIGFEYLSNDRN